jgi:hypothetical protein
VLTEGVRFARDERWLLVQRIISSQHFTKALQLREILLYVTHRILLDEAAVIPEHEIACKVLGRRENFNSNDDNIVRVQVGHLRRRLDQYFSLDGREEPVILMIPKGTYVPSFVPRQLKRSPKSTAQYQEKLAAVSAVNTSNPEASPPSPEQAKLPSEPVLSPYALPSSPLYRTEKNLPWSRARWIWLSLALAAGLGTAFYSYSHARKSRPIEATKGFAGNLIVERIFESDRPISIVVSDTNLVLLQNVLHTDISIDDYTSSQYPSNILSRTSDSSLRSALETAAEGRYTSLGDLAIASRCEETARQFGTKTVIRYARYTHAREFEKGNLILIGSRRGNPWVSMFEPQLNFIFEEDTETHLFHFRNKHPATGEQEIYSNVSDKRRGYVSYVDIALLSNLSKTGNVLLLNGAVMDSNEAASELIFGKELPATLSNVIGVQAAAKAQGIEIFLRVHSVQGTANGFDVVAVRQFPW